MRVYAPHHKRSQERYAGLCRRAGFWRPYERAEERVLRRRETAVDEDAVVALLFALHVADRVQFGDYVVARMRNQKLRAAQRVGDQFRAALIERFHAFAGQRADEKSIARQLPRPRAHLVAGRVHFVENRQDRFLLRT